MSTEMKRIGSRIKELREKTNIGQKHIANFIGVDQSLISKIESGERTVSSDMLDKLSALLCCPVEYFTSENYVPTTYECAFRTNELDEEDISALATINRIVLNQMQMDKLSEGLNHD